MDSNQWITTKKLAEIKNISERAIRKAISNNKYIARKCSKSYEILVTSLEEIIREKLTNEPEILHPLIDLKKEVPECEKQIALAKYELIQKWNAYKTQSNKSKTKAGKEFLEMYNQGFLYEKLYSKIGNVAIGTIYQWRKKLQDYEDNWQVLIKDYSFGEKTRKNSLKTVEQETFLKYLLSQNKFSIGKATKLTKHTLIEHGIKDLSCDMTYRRFANKYKKENYDTWVFAREGSKALKDKVMPYIKRDISMLEVGEVLIADGHRLAFQVINPFTGKPCRPTIVAYQDWKSGSMVGFEIMVEENTQCIASALRNSIINLGKIPQFCYQDNGKAFRANYFEGLTGLFTNLGIQPVFAKPYNAKAKVIERFWREFQDSFERLLPSFMGSGINDKPAYLMRNEKFHKSSHCNFIPTIEQVIQILNKWLCFHYSQPCVNVYGKTIGEVFELGRGSGVDVARLDDLMMIQEIKNIGRNGIRFLKSDYFSEELYGFKDRVIIKYSMFDLTQPEYLFLWLEWDMLIKN